MTKETFMENLDLIIDGEPVRFDSRLEEIENWDSIAAISFLSLLSTNGKKLPMAALKQAETVADLYRLANGEVKA